MSWMYRAPACVCARLSWGGHMCKNLQLFKECGVVVELRCEVLAVNSRGLDEAAHRYYRFHTATPHLAAISDDDMGVATKGITTTADTKR